MEVFASLGLALALLVADIDATVTFTKPIVNGAAACSGMGSVAEGTTSGVIETVVASTDASDLMITLETDTDAKFDYSDTSKEISISSTAILDYEMDSTINVLIVGEDNNSSTSLTATCVLTLTNEALSFVTYTEKQTISSSIASGSGIQNVSCSDGATSNATYAIESGDDTMPKFTLDSNTGALTTSSTAFDTTVKQYYELVITCTVAPETATATLTICLDSMDNCPSKAFLNTGILTAVTITAVKLVYQLT